MDWIKYIGECVFQCYYIIVITLDGKSHLELVSFIVKIKLNILLSYVYAGIIVYPSGGGVNRNFCKVYGPIII